MAQYTQTFTALNSASTSTSAPWFTADFEKVTASWSSCASLGPSRITVEGSNADGLRASDLGGATSAANWSLVTGINLIGRPAGSESLTAGFRWMRATAAPANHSAASAVSFLMHGIVR